MDRFFRSAPGFLLCVATLFMLSGTLPAQNVPSIPSVEKPAVDPRVQRNIEDWAIQQRGLPDDWTHRYLVFSNPGSEQQASESGKYEEWINIVNDPRFILQQIKRSGRVNPLESLGVANASSPSKEGLGETAPAPDRLPVTVPMMPWKNSKHPLKKDWAVAIGGVAASGIGTIATNNASGTSTVTVDGQIFTGSAPTSAGGAGIFTGEPAVGQGVTITYGSNVLTLTDNATASTVVGTVSAAPTSTTFPTITLTNSAVSNPNTLTLTTSATGATATGTFSGSGSTSGQTITIKNGSNTLVLTAQNGTYGSGTVSVNNANGAANNDTVVIGPVTYIFEMSQSAYSGEPFNGPQYLCQTMTTPCVWWGTTEPNQSQAFYGAIANIPSACPASGYGVWQSTCYSFVTAPNPSVTANLANPGTSTFVTVTNITGNSIPFTATSSQTAWALTPATGSIPGYTTGTNGCTSATVGTFIVSTYPSTSATNLANAINACYGAYSAVGVTAYAIGNVVTIASTTLGSPTSSLTLSNTASNFAWSAVTLGSSSNGCVSATTGTFASGASTAAEASNIAAAINACNSSYPVVGVTASYTSGNTFTVSSVAGGPYLAVGASNNTGLFTWGTVTAGSVGTNTCGSSTSGTFATSNSVATLATNLAAAINACPVAAGVTASSTLGGVILAARVAGSTGDAALGNTMSNFTWAGSNMTGGTDGMTSANSFIYWSGAAAATTAQVATSIATAINENTTLQAAAGVSAASSGGVVTVTANTPGTGGNSYATTVANFAGFTWGAATLAGGVAGATSQPNMYPAKYSFNPFTASCTDFVVYPMGTAGATGAASIVAFSNLYTGGCSGSVPSVYWAYNTGGMVTTSPVLSLDGTQLAYVQVSGTTASLVLLKWSAGSGTPTLPVTPTAATLPTYRGCAAPCMLTMAFSGNHNDSFSSPFYFYNGDTIYVGDDSGNLHKFTGVFIGSPAEAGSPWPVNLSASSKLSSAVYDNVTGKVIVGDFGGALHSVTASSGTVSGTTVSVGDVIADAPLVDSSAGKLYAFVTTSTYADNGDNAVYELPTNFTSITGASIEPLGTGGAGYYMYAGTFDNVYYSSSNATGNLYAIGNTGVTTGATLYQIPVANSVLGTPVAAVGGLSVAGAVPWPSPLNEFCNNGTSACVASATQTTSGTDYIFFSLNRGNKGGCTTTAGNGCVLSYIVSNPAAVTLSGTGLKVTTPAAGNGCWPTGGIIIDNSVGTLAGASQTYFIGLGSNTAGGPTGTTQTSSNCAATTASTVSATQTSQSNP